MHEVDCQEFDLDVMNTHTTGISILICFGRDGSRKAAFLLHRVCVPISMPSEFANHIDQVELMVCAR